MPDTCRRCGRLRASDSYSGEGGMGVGLMRAGFCVTPVDTDAARLARYPVDCAAVEPVHGDAIAHLIEHGHRFALRHTSPPCTGYTQATSAIPDRVSKYDRLIAATREALLITGGPYIIENVTSRLTRAELRSPLMLCWTEFYRPGSVLDTDGTPLWMRRHRLFESNLPLLRRGGCAHPPSRKGAPGFVQCAGAYGGARRDKDEARNVRKGGYAPHVTVMRRLLDAPWMTEEGCKLSIPPAYAEHLGRQAHDLIRQKVDILP